jgi:hypothetical protein
LKEVLPKNTFDFFSNLNKQNIIPINHSNNNTINLHLLIKNVIYCISPHEQHNNAFFVVGRSIMSLIVKEVVRITNIKFKSMMLWPIGKMIQMVVVKFKEWCGLPSVHGVIDGTHFKRSKDVLYLTMISIIK